MPTIRDRFIAALRDGGFAPQPMDEEIRLAYLKREQSFLILALDQEAEDYLVTKFKDGDFYGSPLFEGSREECNNFFDDYLRAY